MPAPELVRRLQRGLAAGLITALALPPGARAQAPQAAASAAAVVPVPDATAADPAGDLTPPAQVAPVTVAADGLDLENADALKGLGKVALAGVAVYVMTESSGAATAGAAYRGSMAYVNSSLKVTGLDAARLQALADDAHDRVVAALKSRGVEVLPMAELQALPEYAALAALGDKAPLAIDASAGKGTVYSGRGLPLIHMDELAWLNRMVGGLFGAKVEDPFVSLGDRMASGFRKTRLDPALEALAKAAGASLAMVRIVLSPAQVKASGGAWSLSASAKVRDSLVMPAWTNRLWLLTPKGERARVSLKSALASETPPGRIVDVTSTASKVADVATTVLTFAAAFSGVGRGVSQSTKDLELRTTPDWFEAVARPQVDTALQALAQAVAP
jgi:hypothetical protein